MTTEKKGTPIWKLALLVLAGLPATFCALALVAAVMSAGEKKPKATVAAAEPIAEMEPHQPVPHQQPATPPAAPTPRKWYEGGTLHKATGAEWRKADASNKLATCSDFLAKLWEAKRLSGKLTLTVKTIEDLKAPAASCVEAVDKAYESPEGGAEDVMATQDVATVALLTMTMMGFISSGS